MIEVTLVARFDSPEVAREALAAMEEVVGQHNGDLEDSNINEEETT